jgi:hypothetical protein
MPVVATAITARSEPDGCERCTPRKRSCRGLCEVGADRYSGSRTTPMMLPSESRNQALRVGPTVAIELTVLRVG